MGLTEEQADQAWDFLEGFLLQIDLVVIQCEAGASRSPGMAAAIAEASGNADHRFKAPNYAPNPLVTEIMLKSYQKRRKDAENPSETV